MNAVAATFQPAANCCPTCRQTLPADTGMIVDEAGVVVANGRVAALTRHEAAMLSMLAAANGRVQTKQQLMDELYWLAVENDEPDIKIVDVWICKMRAKLRPLGVEIQTVWGVGYRLLPVAGAPA